MTDSLPSAVIERLSTTGCTSAYVAELLGIPRRKASRLLLDAGAVQSGGFYRIVGRIPLTYGSARACVRAPMTPTDFHDAGRE